MAFQSPLTQYNPITGKKAATSGGGAVAPWDFISGLVNPQQFPGPIDPAKGAAAEIKALVPEYNKKQLDAANKGGAGGFQFNLETSSPAAEIYGQLGEEANAEANAIMGRYGLAAWEQENENKRRAEDRKWEMALKAMSMMGSGGGGGGGGSASGGGGGGGMSSGGGSNLADINKRLLASSKSMTPEMRRLRDEADRMAIEKQLEAEYSDPLASIRAQERMAGSGQGGNFIMGGGGGDFTAGQQLRMKERESRRQQLLKERQLANAIADQRDVESRGLANKQAGADYDQYLMDQSNSRSRRRNDYNGVDRYQREMWDWIKSLLGGS